MPTVTIPPLAFSSWRLNIPGGPQGGQYHGFIAPDSLESWAEPEGYQGGWPAGSSEIGPTQTRPSGHSEGPQGGSSAGPWDKSFGGTAFDEGQTHSDYVYRGPGETRPNPNASGGANVIAVGQVMRTPGYSEAPGNYEALGRYSPWNFGAAAEIGILPNRIPRGEFGANPTIIHGPNSGATSVVGQPAPNSPAPVHTVRNRNQWSNQGQGSPAPSPTVAASPADYQPSEGRPLFSISPTTAALSPGETQQFAASVPVTWSAVYGTITGNGLYTAPTQSSAPQDTVTATPLNQAAGSPYRRGGQQATNAESLSAVVTILPTALTTATNVTDPSLVTPAPVDISGWLTSQTIVAGIPNYAIAGVGLLAAYLLMRRK